MVVTYGLTHVAIAVASPARSFAFYRQLLGARLLGAHVGREDSDLGDAAVLEWGTPGAHDVITLRRADDGKTGTTADLAHFGFRLAAAEDPDEVARAVERAGGTVTGKGRFDSGDPVVFATDPDGYEIELWFERDPAWRTDGA